jgi:hypothetical protein
MRIELLFGIEGLSTSSEPSRIELSHLHTPDTPDTPDTWHTTAGMTLFVCIRKLG